DLTDVGVSQLHADLRLVLEHRDELFVLRDVGEDALDRHQALEAAGAEDLPPPDLGHAADVDPVEQQVPPEGDRLLLRRGAGQGWMGEELKPRAGSLATGRAEGQRGADVRIRRLHSPLNAGARFSRNATMPSWKSAEASSFSWPRTSPSSASSRVEWLAASTAAFTAR